ncbi:MAG: M48 family metallopeptidase [Parcubacteria group bacterium]|nr:M48 family metallopeptidase [Parcubacteria group bacterium]
MTIYSHKEANTRKTWLFFALFFALIICFGWILSLYYGDSSILYVAVAFSILMNVLSYWFSDKIVLAMTRAKAVDRENAPELYNIVENLTITAGLPMPKVYLIPENAPNAFATGRNSKHAVVAVTEGLLERLDRSELEGVIAHELSHIGNRDMLLSTAVVVMVGLVSILSDMFLRSLYFGGRRDRDSGGNIFAILAIIGAVLAPIAAVLIQLAISRKREFLADASGVLLTRYPEGLARALEKISTDRTPMCAASNATAHLWLDDPFKGKNKASFFRKLFMTHPPVEERIKALMEMSV